MINYIWTYLKRLGLQKLQASFTYYFPHGSVRLNFLRKKKSGGQVTRIMDIFIHEVLDRT